MSPFFVVAVFVIVLVFLFVPAKGSIHLQSSALTFVMNNQSELASKTDVSVE
jgi:hypothetical protein